MSFNRDHNVKAVRKDGRCNGCSHMVEVGQPAVRWAGLTDGDFGTAIYHPECRAAELALNLMQGNGSDDWWSLLDIEHDDYRWLLEEHPLAAARKNITAETIQEHEKERDLCRQAWAKQVKLRVVS